MENLNNQLLHNPSYFKAQGPGGLWGWRSSRGFPREPSVGTTGPDGLRGPSWLPRGAAAPVGAVVG